MTTDRAAPSADGWYAEAVERVLAGLEAGPEGLSDDEARARRERYGPNRLRPPQRRGPLARLLAQFHNVLIYVLLGAAVVTALLGHGLDTGVILGVVLINALIGFIQEGKAESALEAIRDLLSPQATVLRDGRRRVLAAEELVPGDVVLLQPGDKVPADLRLLDAKSLQIDEAALTGESVPVEKDPRPAPGDAALGDRHSMAFSGTLVTYGQGRGVVVATGDATEIGRISDMLAQVAPLTTPLLRQLAGFGRTLTDRDPGDRRSHLPLRGPGPRLRAERDVPRRGRHRGGGDPRGPAGDHDHRAGDRRPAHGARATPSSAACRRSRPWAR